MSLGYIRIYLPTYHWKGKVPANSCSAAGTSCTGYTRVARCTVSLAKHGRHWFWGIFRTTMRRHGIPMNLPSFGKWGFEIRRFLSGFGRRRLRCVFFVW